MPYITLSLVNLINADKKLHLKRKFRKIFRYFSATKVSPGDIYQE